MSHLLEATGLTKRFGGHVALKGVSFTIEPGEMVGILGPNGAGKTTLFNLLTGFIPSDDGAVKFEGESIVGLPPHRIVNRGLARTFQLARPFVGMSVLENVMVGCLAPRVRKILSAADRMAQAKRLLEQVGLGDKTREAVEVLSYGDLRRLELARALATKPKLLLLDEPFAGLSTSEIGDLASLIRKLQRDEGFSVLIIEHRLEEFMQLVTRVIAMDFGEIIGTDSPAAIVRNPRVIEAYLGSPEGLTGTPEYETGGERGAA